MFRLYFTILAKPESEQEFQFKVQFSRQQQGGCGKYRLHLVTDKIACSIHPAITPAVTSGIIDKSENMAVYLNIIIPVKTFLETANEVMSKYKVKLYIEKASVNQHMMRRFYVKDDISEKDFSDEAYRCFFFSVKDLDLTDKEIVLESGKVKHHNWYSFYDDSTYAIEGTGGREDKDNIECIRLRQIAKEADKQIRTFYHTLQTRLKNSGNIKRYHQKGLSVYYVETGKSMWSYFEKRIPFIMK